MIRYDTGKRLGRQGLSSDRYGLGASRVIPPSLIEELLDTYQMWEEREHKTNMLTITYWLIALHLYPRLSERPGLWQNGQWPENHTR